VAVPAFFLIDVTVSRADCLRARRMLEKYPVQLWVVGVERGRVRAQQLGTAQTVSDTRIRKMLSP
jgi:hypothetical protein